MSNQACGFVCPKCGCDDAEVLKIYLPQLDLKCEECGFEYCGEL